jgi:hypothetical protein
MKADLLKQLQNEPGLEEALRTEFERQHAGRDLTRHRMRGTYIRADIAAIWNQHVRTALWMIYRMRRPNPANGAPKPPGHNPVA